MGSSMTAPSQLPNGNVAGLDIRSQIMAERQRAELNAVIGALSELAFEECVSRPSSSMSGSEASCVRSVVAKYLDTNEFVMGRMMRKGGK